MLIGRCNDNTAVATEHCIGRFPHHALVSHIATLRLSLDCADRTMAPEISDAINWRRLLRSVTGFGFAQRGPCWTSPRGSTSTCQNASPRLTAGVLGSNQMGKDSPRGLSEIQTSAKSAITNHSSDNPAKTRVWNFECKSNAVDSNDLHEEKHDSQVNSNINEIYSDTVTIMI
jgi:hypothetical protein